MTSLTIGPMIAFSWLSNGLRAACEHRKNLSQLREEHSLAEHGMGNNAFAKECTRTLTLGCSCRGQRDTLGDTIYCLDPTLVLSMIWLGMTTSRGLMSSLREPTAEKATIASTPMYFRAAMLALQGTSVGRRVCPGPCLAMKAIVCPVANCAIVTGAVSSGKDK